MMMPDFALHAAACFAPHYAYVDYFTAIRHVMLDHAFAAAPQFDSAAMPL